MRHAAITAMTFFVYAGLAQADTFGTGGNQFDIDFVTITGATNPASGYGVVADDYRIGTLEITNDQWDKFVGSLGVPVTGSPLDAYDDSPTHTGADVPANGVSWYEAAQFVNYLNTSTGRQAAYNFYETTPEDPATLVFDVWTGPEAAGGTNLYRHKDAFYFLPTEDEWAKAAYWNGSNLQTWATPDDTVPSAGTDSNCDSVIGQPWNVGSGSEELNGTFDMMGNVWEWVEGPHSDPSYGAGSDRGLRGGSYVGRTWVDGSDSLASSSERHYSDPSWDNDGYAGFRVASVPEPATLGLLSLGGLAVLKRRKARVVAAQND